MTTTPQYPPELRTELNALRHALLRIGLLAARPTCTPAEKARLRLCAQELEAGQLTDNVRQLNIDLAEIVRHSAMLAQAAVSRAAAAPEDPRRR